MSFMQDDSGTGENEMTLNYQLVCLWCGSIASSEVPIASSENTIQIKCGNCNKIIIEFFEVVTK